jgi:uncharacterized membrane protein
MRVTKQSRARTAFRWLLAVFYFFAGVAHLRSPNGFLAITPDWVPWPETVIALTGVCEIAGAIALAFMPRMRAAAGIGLALYAVCVYPANIKHAVEGIVMNGQQLSWWYHGPRLAFQPVFVWWALWAGGVTDWPFSRRPGSSLI